MPIKKVAKNKVAKKTPKKVVKKASVKAPKKTTVKKSGQKALVIAKNEQSFWLVDGGVLNSLVALRNALDTMEVNVFAYHALGVQNDFGHWVSNVLNDTECAKDLEKAKTSKAAKTAITKHLKSYSL
jgi:hypothetical protein